MTHCVYFAYGRHLHRRYGRKLIRRDQVIYDVVRKISGHSYDDPTFGGVIPAMIKWMADGHGLWPVVQYQTFYRKDALLQEARKEHGVIAWALTKLAPNGKVWDEVGLRPAMYFIPGHAYEAGENQDGKAKTMAIQLRPGWGTGN